MTALTLRGVSRSFGATTVLHGVDLDVPARELTAILGPSGCGKTTLLRLIAGFLDPDSGTIAFGDKEVFRPGRSVPPQRRRVGYVPQEGALFPHLDVAGNITFGMARSARRQGTRVAELLDLVGLPFAVSTRLPHELSGGQQQRVALARALAPSPSVVLLDEPFASLDAGLREGTGRAVADALRAAGATGILVTHDQGEALSLADQVAVMRDGRLAQVGTPRQVYDAPADLDVARFVGGAVVLPAVVSGAGATSVLGTLSVADGVAQGPVEVLVRPEQIILTPSAPGTSADAAPGAVPLAPGATGPTATVREVSYFGHDCAVRLQLAGSGQQVTARTVGEDAPEPGAVVSLSVRGPVSVFVDGSAGGGGVAADLAPATTAR
jgi:iron(III) transport system ATP-binding protein